MRRSSSTTGSQWACALAKRSGRTRSIAGLQATRRRSMRFWPVTGFRWWTNEAIRLLSGRWPAGPPPKASSTTPLPSPLSPPPPLVYRLDKRGGQDVHARLSRGGQGLGALVSDASGSAPLAIQAPLRGNPVILYFLEQDIAGMRQSTGG